MQQGVLPFVYSFSHFLLLLLSSKVILAKDQNESLEKDGVWQAGNSRGTKSEQALVKEKKDNSQATAIGFGSINSQPSYVGLDYKSADRPWQKDENEKKPQKRRNTKRQWGRKYTRRKNRQKKDAQNQPTNKMKQKRWGKENSGGGMANRNRRGKGNTNRKQTKNTNLNRKKRNWVGGKTRKWKGKNNLNGKGKRNPSSGKRKKWKSTRIKRIQNQNKIIRSFEFIYFMYA